MDEKGFLIGFLTKSKRIYLKKAYEKGTLIGNDQDGNRERIIILACICTDSTDIPLALIYQAVTSNLQDS
jgi:hypothetical protein